LPTAPTEPVDDLGFYSWLIYGAKKIGKTSIAAQFPGSLFFMFEPGAKALRLNRLDIGTWGDALGYLTELEKAKKAGTLRFKTVVIDTGFECYESCKNYVCDKLGVDYPSETNFGKDWSKIKTEFRSFFNRLSALRLGLVVLCHEGFKEQQDFKGNKYDQVVPLLSSAANDFFRAIIDNVVWYHFRRSERFLLIKGNDHAMSGVALQADRFFKSRKGEPIFAVPLGESPVEGYKNILNAFANKQELTYKDEVEAEAARAIIDSKNEKIRKRK